jgi:predicted DNA-binding transcriptional regulator AlpA
MHQPNGLADAVPADAPADIGTAPAVDPLLWGRRDLARALGISLASLDRLEAGGRIGPRPVRLGGRLLYAVEECREWTRCRGPDGQLPDRRTWEAMRDAAQRNGRH